MAVSVVVAGATIARNASSATPSRHLVVVELYQSQGCSSCPPADEILNSLAPRSDVLPLSFAVTYWDYLGWKDPYARSDYAQRQRDFAGAHGSSIVATPQFVVDGKSIVSGGDREALEAAMRIASKAPPGPSIGMAGGAIVIGSGKPSRTATVWLLRYDPSLRSIHVDRGENGGRTLTHRNIVTSLRRVGSWTGKPLKFVPPAYRDPAERSAILIQAGTGGPIIGAARL